MEPRREPVPGAHRLRLYGRPDGVRALCTTCDWARTLEGGHTPEDFVRLEAMHAQATAPEGTTP
jgi:hypothetical protein